MKTVKYVLLGIVFGATLSWLVRDCRDGPLKAENEDLKSQIVVMKTALEKLEAEGDGKVEALMQQISTLQGHIDSLMTYNSELQGDLDASNTRLNDEMNRNQALRSSIDSVISENPLVRDFILSQDRIIAELKGQVFTLTEDTKTLSAALASSIEQKDKALEAASIERAQKEAEKALRLKVERRLAVQDKRVAHLERGRALLTWGPVAITVTVVLLAIL